MRRNRTVVAGMPGMRFGVVRPGRVLRVSCAAVATRALPPMRAPMPATAAFAMMRRVRACQCAAASR